mmetsp:Transcript_92214/g.192831  ORF Transcript_92214/g.192831 Transcript_92214/m.192831 type:complete len:373 (+) Transcript_92214:146-1264(+)
MPATSQQASCYSCFSFLDEARTRRGNAIAKELVALKDEPPLPAPYSGTSVPEKFTEKRVEFALEPRKAQVTFEDEKVKKADKADEPDIQQSSNSRWTLTDLVRRESSREAMDGEVVLSNYADYRRQKDFASACSLFSEDCIWSTLHEDIISGREALLDWMENEHREGRRNRAEQPWIRWETNPNMFWRECKVTFPSKATHEIMQTATVQNGLITRMVVEPKYPALRCAIRFAQERASTNDEFALDLMAEDVKWITWDGFRCKGKEGVRKLFRDQKGREVKREGTTEFEAAQVNEVGGVFTRDLLIERVDGIKVKTIQQVYVMGVLTEMDPVKLPNGETKTLWGMVPKIVEVRVLASEEMVDGKWVKCGTTTL